MANVLYYAVAWPPPALDKQSSVRDAFVNYHINPGAPAIFVYFYLRANNELYY